MSLSPLSTYPLYLRADFADSPVVYSVTAQDVSVHPDVPASNNGKPLLAISGAIIWPGIGHFLVGCYFTGLFWFALAISIALGLASVVVNPQWLNMLGILVPLAILVGVVQLFDALRAARCTHPSVLPEPVVRYFAAAVLMIAGIAWQHRVISYLQNHVLEICYTPTPSMAPVLAKGDRFVDVKDMPFGRWDIVGFNAPRDRYNTPGDKWMKRVIGLPGETVEITRNGILINQKLIGIPAEAGPYQAVDQWGQPLFRPSRTAANGCWGRPITLGSDEYFLLGDNTMESTDARYWPSVNGHQPGAMPRDQITCRVIAICWPPDRWRILK
jgi:signal peptidase I